MFWIQLVVMFAVVFVVCMLALGADGGMGRVFPDRADVVTPRDRLMVRQDVDAIRFSTGLRGYRMDEVDDTLDRLADELEMRDTYIAELRTKLGTAGIGAGNGTATAAPTLDSPSTDATTGRPANATGHVGADTGSAEPAGEGIQAGVGVSEGDASASDADAEAEADAHEARANAHEARANAHDGAPATLGRPTDDHVS